MRRWSQAEGWWTSKWAAETIKLVPNDHTSKRRCFFKHAAITLIFALSINAGLFLNAEGAMGASIDEKFRGAMSQAAALRATDRSAGIDISFIFKNFIDEYSLSGFRNYLSEHHDPQRGTFTGVNTEIFDLSASELRALDRRFLSLDRVRIFFKYTKDWTSIDSFRVVLANNAL